jgi:hypothetical protein
MTDPATFGPKLAWRLTWPVGPADDFVADLPDAGWTRLKRVDDHLGHHIWHWTIGGRASPAAGSAETREAAEETLRRRLPTEMTRN